MVVQLLLLLLLARPQMTAQYIHGVSLCETRPAESKKMMDCTFSCNALSLSLLLTKDRLGRVA